MTEIQRLQIRLAELRKQINGREFDNLAAEKREEIRADFEKAEEAYLAELKREAGWTGRADDDGESAELRAMLEHAHVGAILAAVRAGQEADGGTRELQSHLGVSADVVPWAMLRRSERRAAATFTGGGDPAMVGGYTTPAYPDSIAAYCGFQIETPDAGVQQWPTVTSKPTITRQTDSTTVAETNGTIAVSELSPRNRYQAAFSVRQQDLLVFDQAGMALSETLRMATRDSIDADALNRTDVGLLQFGVDPAAPGAETTFAQYVSAMYGAVDGVYAVEAGQVRMVVGATILAHMGGQYVTGSDMSAAEKFMQLSGGLRVSNHVPAYGANAQQAVVCKINPAIGPNAVMALFNGGPRIIVDEVTKADEGEVKYTAQFFGDFAVLRSDGYIRHAFRNS